jgi:hypothetical protein
VNGIVLVSTAAAPVVVRRKYSVTIALAVEIDKVGAIQYHPVVLVPLTSELPVFLTPNVVLKLH